MSPSILSASTRRLARSTSNRRAVSRRHGNLIGQRMETWRITLPVNVRLLPLDRPGLGQYLILALPQALAVPLHRRTAARLRLPDLVGVISPIGHCMAKARSHTWKGFTLGIWEFQAERTVGVVLSHPWAPGLLSYLAGTSDSARLAFTNGFYYRRLPSGCTCVARGIKQSVGRTNV